MPIRHPKSVLSANAATNKRRYAVLEWYLNGYMYQGQRMDIRTFAAVQGVTVKTIKEDITAIRKKVSKHLRKSGAFRDRILHMFETAAEMALHDRGRALAMYERLERETYDENGNPLPKVERDTGYQMSAFLRLAQQSQEQYIKLLNIVITRNENVAVIAQHNTINNIKYVSISDATKMLEANGEDMVLPSVQYRKLSEEGKQFKSLMPVNIAEMEDIK